MDMFFSGTTSPCQSFRSCSSWMRCPPPSFCIVAELMLHSSLCVKTTCAERYQRFMKAFLKERRFMKAFQKNRDLWKLESAITEKNIILLNYFSSLLIEKLKLLDASIIIFASRCGYHAEDDRYAIERALRRLNIYAQLRRDCCLMSHNSKVSGVHSCKVTRYCILKPCLF